MSNIEQMSLIHPTSIPDMENILTLEEVVERIQKVDRLPRQPQMLDTSKLRPEYHRHQPEFYVPKLTRRLLNIMSST